MDFLLKQIDRLGDAHAVAGRKLRSLRREVARQAAANPALRPQDSVTKFVYFYISCLVFRFGCKFCFLFRKAPGPLAAWLPAVALVGAAAIALFYVMKRSL